jgi:LuxR family maltose regulon positive regulatory protein
VALLDDLVPRKRVTLVAAPAGFGKTTAVAQWCRRSRTPAAWLSPTGLAEAPRALATALEAAETPVVVIDDVHLLEAAAAQTMLGPLVEHAALHLVLVGRHAPPLPLERLRVADELGEVTVDELGYTTEELTWVLRAAGRPSTPDDAVRFRTRTAGWPAAARLALAAPEPAASDSHLADYVREEVLNGLRPELRRFVLDATTCERLDRRLVVALTGHDDNAALLEECRELGLFVDRSIEAGGDPGYRWHAVFAAACRTVLVGNDPGRADRLDRAAAAALAPQFPLQAVVHARRANDPALATRIIADHWLELVLGSDAAALEQQCLTLPPAWSESAIVLLVRACCRNLSDDRATSETLVARADAVDVPTDAPERFRVSRELAALLLADGSPALEAVCDRVARLLREPVGWTPASHAATTFLLGWAEMRLRRDPPAAVRLLEAAQQGCATTGQEVVARRAVVNGAFALAYAGRFAAARHKLAEILPPDTGLEGWTTVEYAIEWMTDGFVAYWQDDVDLALRRMRVQAVRNDGPGSPSAVGRAYFGCAAAADGRPSVLDEAEGLLRETSRGERHGVPFHVYTLLGLAMVAIARGRPRRARGLLDEIPDYPHTHILRVHMAEAYRQIGDVQEALTRLAGLEPALQLPYVNATAWTTRALIEFAGGDLSSARVCLGRALETAVPESVRRPFVGTDPLLRDLLAEHAAHGTRHTAFVADCLARCELAAMRRSGRGEPLTRRELEVLGHLRTTMTIAEIAVAMGLSVNTVKTHVRTTYRKLGVASRREAVRVTS